MNLRIIKWVLVLVSAITFADGGREVLFDGSNLNRFNKVGDANWNIVSGNVEATSGNGFLVTKESYSTFVLTLEFYAEKGTNSGVFFRCNSPTDINDKRCYEMNIFDTRPDPKYRTGSIVNVAAPLKHLETEGKWNQAEIVVDLNSIKATLNGETTVNVSGNLLLKDGPIALQYAKGGIKFRNVRVARIKSLDSSLQRNIRGVWNLTGFEMEDPSGNVTPWCVGSHGTITYTKNHMTVSINCSSNPSKKVFYAGPYSFEGDTVIHAVKNYGDESLNKTFRRQVEMPDADTLNLIGTLSDGGKARILWERQETIE